MRALLISIIVVLATVVVLLLLGNELHEAAAHWVRRA